MAKSPKTFRPAGQPDRRDQNRLYDMRRGSAASRGYNHRWMKARNTYLAKHPLCVMCKADGLIVCAEVVDHIIPHRGDQELFWDSKGNWQSLCKPCHNSPKQSAEKRGR